MASRLSPGGGENCWYGMRHALTPLPRHTRQVPLVRLEQWQLKQRRGRRPNMYTSTPYTPSPQWPLRHLVFSGQRPCGLCGSLVSGWSVSLGKRDPLTILYRDCRWQCNLATQHQCWAQWTSLPPLRVEICHDLGPMMHQTTLHHHLQTPRRTKMRKAHRNRYQSRST